MNIAIRRHSACLLILPILLRFSTPAFAQGFTLFQSKEKSKKAVDETTARLREIDQATNGFADRYVTYLTDSCDRVIKDNPDTEARTQALRLKLFTADSVYSIASSPNPLGQLLDMCVVVTLQKINWIEEGRARKVFGDERAKAVVGSINNAYEEVWDIAARFLTPQEMAETKKLIRQWRAKHSDLALLPYVRFDDFAKARAGLEQQNPTVEGLFKQIGEANLSIQSAQTFGEHALYYAERAPRLMQWQTERTVQALYENPDVQRTLAVAENLSNSIADESKKFQQDKEDAEKMLDEVNQITANGRDLLAQARETSATLTETVKTANQLVLTLNPPDAPGAPARRPFDIMDYSNAIEKFGASAHETRLVVDSADHLLTSPAFDTRLAELEDFTRRRSDHVAELAMGVIVFFFAMQLLTRWISSKWFGGKR